MDTLTRSKSMAKALRNALADRQVYLSHSACLEIVARQFGFHDWNVLNAACGEEMQLALAVIVQHGRQQEAANFYTAAFGATRTDSYRVDNELLSVDLQYGDIVISVTGANPRREAEPARGGPFFPKAMGAVSTVYCLRVSDAKAALQKAVAAGAVVRQELDYDIRGQRGATFFDPFGHIWAVIERSRRLEKRAA